MTKPTPKTPSRRRISIEIDNLLLDDRNPRLLLDKHTQHSQDALISRLCEADHAMELVRSIGTNGYWDFDPIVVIPHEHRKGEFVVIEGNRRVAALKILRNPLLAPDPDRTEAKRYAAEVQQSAISPVPCVVVENRDSVDAYLLQRHAQTPTQAWSTAVKSHFIKDLLERGYSLQDLRRMGGDNLNIERELRRYYLYEALLRAPMSKSARSALADPRKINFTTFERITTNTAGQSWLRIRFDSENYIVGTCTKQAFLKGLGAIGEAVINGKIDSRTANSTTEIKKALRRLSADRPGTTGKFAAEDIVASDPEPIPDESESSETSPKRRSVRRSMSVIPTGFICRSTDARIRDILEELRRLSLKDHPNATAVLLRTLLEISVWHFLQSRNRAKECEIGIQQAHHERVHKKNDHPPTFKPQKGYIPGLRDTLHWLLANDVLNELLSSKDLNNLKLFLSAAHSGNLDVLNAFVHNSASLPTDTDLKSAWAKIEPLLKITIGEHSDAAHPS